MVNPYAAACGFAMHTYSNAPLHETLRPAPGPPARNNNKTVFSE